MSSGSLTRATVRFLDWIAEKSLAAEKIPPHQRTGRRGEEDAYFYLRKRGYAIVARNFRSPHHRGEIDLIGWDKDVLCFVEVKARTTRQVKPAEAAVDREKRRELMRVASDYLRHLAPSCQWRFDVISVYYDSPSGQPQFELFQNTLAVA